MAALEGAFFNLFLIFGIKSSFITLKCTLQKKKDLLMVCLILVNFIYLCLI